MSNYCSQCGYNMTPDHAVERDGFRVELGQGLSYQGKEILLTPLELSFVHSLACYPGRFIDGYTLLARAGSETAEAEISVARVVVSKTKRSIIAKIEAAGAPAPIEGRAGYGVRWKPAADLFSLVEAA